MAQNSIKFIPQRTKTSAGMTADYVAINASGLEEACSSLTIQNATNKVITLSFDGSTDHRFLPVGATWLLEAQTNNQPASKVSLLPRGTIVYVKGDTGTGDVYLSGCYV